MIRYYFAYTVHYVVYILKLRLLSICFLSCFHNLFKELFIMHIIKGVKKYYTSKVGGPLIANPLIAELESISGLAFSVPSFLKADLTSANRLYDLKT
jgi:hypothetical protein